LKILWFYFSFNKTITAPRVCHRIVAAAQSSTPVSVYNDLERCSLQFAYPDLKSMKPVSNMPTQTFVFILTGANGQKRFGTCRRFLPFGSGDPCSIVLLTRERPEVVLLNQLLTVAESKVTFGSLSACLPLLDAAASVSMTGGEDVVVRISKLEG
jgi:hypothetical protein